MITILGAAVAAGGAAFGSGMLTCRMAGPVAVGQAVTCVGGITRIGTTGGTVFGDAVLRRTVLRIMVGRGVATVLVGTLAAIGTGIQPSVLRSAVVVPAAIGIGTMGCAGIQIFVTIVAVGIIRASIPFVVRLSMGT